MNVRNEYITWKHLEYNEKEQNVKKFYGPMPHMPLTQKFQSTSFF